MLFGKADRFAHQLGKLSASPRRMRKKHTQTNFCRALLVDVNRGCMGPDLGRHPLAVLVRVADPPDVRPLHPFEDASVFLFFGFAGHKAEFWLEQFQVTTKSVALANT